MKGLVLMWATLVVWALSSPISAHHGTNISYSHDRPMKLTGTVTEFAFTNPHAQIYIEVKDEEGNIVPWAVETNSPYNLRQAGWTQETLTFGDVIDVTVFPSKAGTAVGVMDRSQPLLVNGEVALERGEQDE